MGFISDELKHGGTEKLMGWVLMFCLFSPMLVIGYYMIKIFCCGPADYDDESPVKRRAMVRPDDPDEQDQPGALDEWEEDGQAEFAGENHGDAALPSTQLVSSPTRDLDYGSDAEVSDAEIDEVEFALEEVPADDDDLVLPPPAEEVP